MSQHKEMIICTKCICTILKRSVWKLKKKKKKRKTGEGSRVTGKEGKTGMRWKIEDHGRNNQKVHI